MLIVTSLNLNYFVFSDFSGPVLGGFLTEKHGFKNCVTYVAYACGAMVSAYKF